MWWKLVLLMIYLAVLFVLSRILEAVAYYQGGYLAYRLLDPVSLSVRKLKAILDQRGVSYNGVVERGELTALIQKSGDVLDGELESATLNVAEEEGSAAMLSSEVVTTNFTCGMHFYEEVEDTKDSVWVVQVIHDRSRMFVPHRDWKAFVKKVSRFGVRTGIFDCSFDRSLCDKKNWHRPQLVLAMPQGFQAKDHVIIRSYSRLSRPQAIFDWVNSNLASRVTDITSLNDLTTNWLQFQPTRRKQEKVHVVLYSTMKIPPMFLSVLSVKFTGRVKFGKVRILEDVRGDGWEASDPLNVTKLPTYQIITPEETKSFGASPGEYLNYQSMALTLRMLHPEVNDIFLLSLVIVNMACLLEFFISRGNVLKRFGRALWSVVKWNFLLILLWLPVLGLFQLPYVGTVFDHALTALRFIGTTRFAACIRSDWLWYMSVGGWTFLVTSFIVYAFIIGALHHIYRQPLPPSAENSGLVDGGFTALWTHQWESYLNSVFQPAARPRAVWPPIYPYTGIAGSSGTGSDIGMELLIERLAVPNLWLQPVISTQYIHDLPVWKYFGPCRPDSDIGSDDGGDLQSQMSSGDELGETTASVEAEGGSDPNNSADVRTSSMSWSEFGQRPLMFMCERCRALQASLARSEQDLERERLESESACAKYLMDGNYKCMCGTGNGGSRGTEVGDDAAKKTSDRGKDDGTVQKRSSHSAHGSRASQLQNCSNAKVTSTTGSENDCHDRSNTSGMPTGIIPTTDCSICLESYKRSALICGLPCGHAFHQQCIMGWLGRDNHCCPICRWPAYKAKPCNIHQHFD